jgi:hypothetical protein
MMGSGNTGWAYINQEVAKELGVSPLAAKVIGQSAAGLTGLEGNTLNAGRTSLSGTMGPGGISSLVGGTPLSAANDVPAAIRPLIEAASKKYGVPAPLLAAIFKHESGFNPSATNPTGGGWGAIGLGQIRKSSGTKLTPQQLLDPAMNADESARMLSELYKQTGDWGKALDVYTGRNSKANAEIMGLTSRYAGGPGAGVDGGGIGGPVPGGAILPSVDAQNQALAASSSAMTEFASSLKGAGAAVDAFAQKLHAAVGDRYTSGQRTPTGSVYPGGTSLAPRPPNQSMMPPGTN